MNANYPGKWDFIKTTPYPLTRAGALPHIKAHQKQYPWVHGSRRERLDYALRQCDLFLKWFAETGEAIFKTEHDKWYSRFQKT